MQQTLNLAEVVRAEVAKAVQQRGRVTVLVTGRTGVGKSTLVNAIFQGDLATTGQGRPVTKHIREISKEDVPLNLIDTRGLEMADFPATMAALQKYAAERAADPDPGRHIHVVWACIAEDLRRVEDAEVRLVEALAQHAPVLAVVTKARADQGFRATVQQLLPKAKNVVRVRALAETLDDGHTLPPMGLVDLVRATMEVVPEQHRTALAAAQKVDLAAKRQRAQAVVAAAATTAAGIGATPIPFSDAVLLVPVQVGMIAGVTAAYGLPLSNSFFSTVLGSLVAGAGGTMTGRAIAGGLLKMVPGAGTVLGGAVSGATAAAVTTGFGRLYIAALDQVCSRTPDQPPSEQEVLAEVRRRLGAGPTKRWWQVWK